MISKMKILVCDDREQHCKILVETIEKVIGKEVTVEGWAPNKLEKTLKTLFGSIEGFLEDDAFRLPVEKTQFDDYDLIVMDNNLTHLKGTGTRLTAESLVGYIRAFTTGTYIISVNKNPDVDFDLRFLIGDYNTRADLALNETHLDNRALWTGNPSDTDDGFIPWYWPRLKDVVKRRQEQVVFVQERLDKEAFPALAFNEDAIGFLSYHAKGALSSDTATNGGDGLSIQKGALSNLFLKADSLPIADDRKRLYEARENSEVQGIIARVVAAYIDRWFRRDILGPQEALVDLPHLLIRLPFLLGERAGDLGEWNDAILKESPPYNLDAELYEKYLMQTEFEHRMWNTGPCFWWPELKHNDRLNEYFLNMEEAAWADAVFCEDTCLFVDRSSKDYRDLVEFSAEFEGNWKRRYVRRISGKHYSPRTRLAV